MDAIPIEPVWNEQSNKQPVILNTKDTEHCPCTGCEHRTKCKEQALACEMFSKWHISKKAKLEKYSKEPCKRYYEKVY